MSATTDEHELRRAAAALPMLTTKIALVPFDGVTLTDPNPRDVVLALGEQITGDVRLAWGVSAHIVYVENFDDVPDDRVPIVIIEDDERLPGHGFHFDIGGRPCALIRNTPGKWPQFVSHELIELLVDPTGGLTAPGPSLDSRTPDQTVNYLIEVCDPVEESIYEGEGGVFLSDFVYPAYYGEEAGPGEQRYSHGKTILEPRGLLTGGYLSWQTLDTGRVFQAFGGDERPGIEASTEIPTGVNNPPLWKGAPHVEELRPGKELSRAIARANRHSVGLNGKGAEARRAVAAQRTKPYPSPSAPRKTGRPYVDALREEIQTFIDLVSGRRRPPVRLEDLILALEAAKASRAAPHVVLEEMGVADELPVGRRPDLITAVIEALREQEKISRLFGDGIFGSGISSWAAYLIP